MTLFLKLHGISGWTNLAQRFIEFFGLTYSVEKGLGIKILGDQSGDLIFSYKQHGYILWEFQLRTFGPR